MEWNLKRCCTSSASSCDDRLTSLADNLLGRILSLLKTKDVAAMQVLSKRMRKALSLITIVDMDDSPLPLIVDPALLDQRFPLFKSFVANVMLQTQSLTRFRLHFGGHKTIRRQVYLEKRQDKACFPDVEPSRLNAWISYPLSHYGLTELDLAFHVKNPSHSKLPPSLFAAQSLEVLKLDSNLVIDDCAHIPLISLPNLKLLNLHSFVFTEDDFVARLVSSCPVLEDLSITCCSWRKSDRLTISSHSLQRLTLHNFKCDEEKNSDLVLFDTPNLQYLYYVDNLASHYSLPHMNALVDASIHIVGLFLFDTLESSFRCLRGLIKLLSHVQRLSLLGTSPEAVHYFDAGASMEQLPVFPNLRTLQLASFLGSDSQWDRVLLPILDRSPLLETLIFPGGLFTFIENYIHPLPSDAEVGVLEADGWRRAETVPSRLKRIEFARCYGIDRELNMIKFLLGKASGLKEFSLTLIRLSEVVYNFYGTQYDRPNLEEFESTLRELPRASNSCSITVNLHI